MASDSPIAVLIDDSGNVLATAPGTPAVSALTVQGDPSGEPIPVTGSFSNPSVGTNNAAIPGSSTQLGGSDGTNLQAARVFDADTGGGTQYVLGAVLRKAASGGSVEAGTSSDPLRTDPTGTTTQPVSAASLPLPSGAATEATLATLLADATFTGRINTLGQKTMANSTPVVLASDQAAIPVTDNGSSLTVDGTVTVTQGTAAALAGYWPVRITDGTNTMPTADTAARSSFHRITDGTNTAAVKAASTAAVAGDPALVVAISPNNTITTSNASVGSNNAAIPTSSTQIGGSDGTNLQAARVFDADTGGGTQYVLGAVLRKTASGGSVEAGTSSDPLRVDPTGTTTQPISAASLPLPTGAATETTLSTRLADTTFTSRINTLGQKTGANSTPVVLASDQSAIPITDNSGSLTVDSAQLPAALVGARLDVNNGAWLGSTAPTVGSKTSANSVPVVIASDQSAVTVAGTVTASIPDATGTGALGALNAAVQVTTAGLTSVGFQLAAGTLVGTIVPEVSFDGGTTWIATFLSDPTTGIKSSSVVFGVANTATSRSIVSVSGSGLTRIRVSAYTSGTANITLRASNLAGDGLARYSTGGAGYTTLTSPNALPLGMVGQVTSYGTLKVTTEGSELFVEPFDGGTVDTTNRWNQTLVSGGVITQASGTLNIATSTVASRAGALSSQNIFRPIGLGFQIFGASVQLEAAALTNNHRFWGLGTQPVSWAAATPIQNGAGFEQDTTGALLAVTYNAGTRTIAATLTRPTDGLNHRYAMYIRADLVFWYLDTLEVPVATAGWPPLGEQTLPVRLHSINHTTPPASAPTFNVMGVGMTETSHSGVQLSDGTFAWRKATIDSTGRLQAGITSATPTQSSVAGSASSVQLLAASTTRKGATIFNDSSAILYVKLGTTASTTSFTVRMVSNAYYEVPFGYLGRIDGIWASATGNARITELA